MSKRYRGNTPHRLSLTRSKMTRSRRTKVLADRLKLYYICGTPQGISRDAGAPGTGAPARWSPRPDGGPGAPDPHGVLGLRGFFLRDRAPAKEDSQKLTQTCGLYSILVSDKIDVNDPKQIDHKKIQRKCERICKSAQHDLVQCTTCVCIYVF